MTCPQLQKGNGLSFWPQTLNKILPFLVMALLLLILFHKALLFGYVLVAADVLQLNLPWADSGQDLKIQNWYLADSVYQFYPWDLYLNEMLRQGELPLWNPYSFAGHPLLANSHSAALNLFNLLFLVFDFATAHNLILILQMYAAGVFAYIYLRHALGVSRFSALMGGTLYMLNGVFVAWLGWRWMSGGALWFPLILFFLDRSLERRDLRYAVLAGIPLAGSLLGGMVQQFLGVLFSLFLYTTIRSLLSYHDSSNRRNLFRSFSSLFVAYGAGCCLAALQLLPTIELIIYSQRDFDLFQNIVGWVKGFPKNFLLSLALLGNFINPYWAGNTQSLDFRTLLVWATVHGNIVEYQGYLGIVGLVLAGIAVAFGRTRTTATFLWMAVLTLLISFATPISLVLYYRWFFIYAFSVATLAALGLEHLISAERPTDILGKVNRCLVRALAGYVVLVSAGNVVLYMWGDSIRGLGRTYLQGRISNYLAYTNNIDYILGRLDALIDNYLVTSPAIYFPALVLSTLILVIGSHQSGWLARRLFPSACLCIASAELLFFGLTFTPAVHGDQIFPSTDVTEFLRQDRSLYRILPVREFGAEPPILPPNTHMPYGIQSVLGYDSLFPRRYAELMTLVEEGQFESLERKLSVVTPLTRYDDRLLDMLNVKYLLVGPGRDIDTPKFARVLDGSMRIYMNKDALPRAFLVSRGRVISNQRDFVTALLSEEFDPHEEVLFETPPGHILAGGSGGGGSAEILDYSAHRVVIRAQTPDKAYLVLGDSYFPGWKAFVQGVERPIYRANYAVRAVSIDPGESTLEFLYDPFSFRLGTWVSVLASLLVLGVLLRVLTQ